MVKFLITLGLALVLAACTSQATDPVTSDTPTESTRSQPSQSEFDEAMDGVATNPDGYELTIVQCINDGEFIDYTWGITNTSDERRTYAFDPVFTTLTGEEERKSRQLVSESVGPGEYMEWDGFFGGGERFPVGDIECRFEVVNSVFELYSDD